MHTHTTTKRAAAKPVGAPQGTRLDTPMRVVAQRLIKERNIAPELIAITFGISATAARGLARKALSRNSADE